jgi:hypothetical protein
MKCAREEGEGQSEPEWGARDPQGCTVCDRRVNQPLAVSDGKLVRLHGLELFDLWPGGREFEQLLSRRLPVGRIEEKQPHGTGSRVENNHQ